MDAWVYLFSKFTHEALLFEALAIFLGIFGYAVFYLIRKRKYGVAGKEVPSNVMKVYLAQLMGDAEEIRNQLFGLLGKGEASARLMANVQFQADAPAAPAAGAGATLAGAPVTTAQLVQDPKLAEKLKELEKKLGEQSTALDTVLNEKMRLEEELANAKSNAGAGGEGKAPDKATADRAGQLTERVKQLEAQLAEYAIIEDDLANLKRLQKENKALKQQIADAGGTPVAPAAVDEKAPAKPAAAAPVATPELAAAPAGATESPAPAEPAAPEGTKAPAPATPELAAAPAAPEVATAPAPVAEAAPAAAAMPDLSGPSDSNIATEAVDPTHAHDADHPADFESLVDVVEKNLADAAKSANVDPNAAAAPEFNLESGPTSEIKPDEKSEEQLQADFEKMLKS